MKRKIREMIKENGKKCVSEGEGKEEIRKERGRYKRQNKELRRPWHKRKEKLAEREKIKQIWSTRE